MKKSPNFFACKQSYAVRGQGCWFRSIHDFLNATKRRGSCQKWDLNPRLQGRLQSERSALDRSAILTRQALEKSRLARITGRWPPTHITDRMSMRQLVIGRQINVGKGWQDFSTKAAAIEDGKGAGCHHYVFNKAPTLKGMRKFVTNHSHNTMSCNMSFLCNITDVIGRIRTCAGRPQWISSPSP